MPNKAATVAQYLAGLPAARRQALAAVRATILAHLDRDLEEGIQYGMIGYRVPHRVSPAGYHCDPKQPLPFACLGSQKNHMVLHLMSLYQDPAELARFTKAWKATGRKLDMGKGCVRFRAVEDVPLDVIADLFQRTTAAKFVAGYEAALAARSSKAGTTGRPARSTAARGARPRKKRS